MSSQTQVILKEIESEIQPVLFYKRKKDGRWDVVNALSFVPPKLMPESTLEMNNSANFVSYTAAQTLRKLKSRKPNLRINKLKNELNHLKEFNKYKKCSPKRLNVKTDHVDLRGNAFSNFRHQYTEQISRDLIRRHYQHQNGKRRFRKVCRCLNLSRYDIDSAIKIFRQKTKQYKEICQKHIRNKK
jgi:hypothetical protein